VPWNYFSLRVLMTECVSVKLLLSFAGYLMGFCRECLTFKNRASYI
jgi:hypothetical protein